MKNKSAVINWAGNVKTEVTSVLTNGESIHSRSSVPLFHTRMSVVQYCLLRSASLQLGELNLAVGLSHLA